MSEKLYSAAATVHKNTVGGFSYTLVNGWVWADSDDEAAGKWLRSVKSEMGDAGTIGSIMATEVTELRTDERTDTTDEGERSDG